MTAVCPGCGVERGAALHAEGCVWFDGYRAGFEASERSLLDSVPHSAALASMVETLRRVEALLVTLAGVRDDAAGAAGDA